MGHMKELYMEQMRRRHSQWPGERYLCCQCVTDPVLVEKLRESSEDKACSYCGTIPSADLIVLLDAIDDCLRAEYEDPNGYLIYDSKEGGYQGIVHYGDELVMDLDPWSDREDLVEDAAAAFSDNLWCEDHGLLKDDDKLRYSWERFSDLIKHRTRHLFFDTTPEEEAWDDRVPPGQMLSELRTLVDEFDLFAVIPEGSTIFRARVHDAAKSPCTAEELGPPPTELTRSNRMSPAGISMFYGAFNPETAVRETFDPECEEENVATVASFRTNRDLLALDLTSLPAFRSQFDRANRHLRRRLGFLREFVWDLSRPVRRDRRERVEYVPTQVVTEFFRYRHRGPGGRSIDGIMYTSSREGDGKAVVLFLGAKECGPRAAARRGGVEEVLSLVAQKKWSRDALLAVVGACADSRSTGT